jgi:hypothetical protein
MLDELSDVDLDSPQPSQSLVYDGTSWKNLNISIENASDTSFSNLQNGNSLVYDSGSWINETLSYSLNDLTNVSASSALAGDVLGFNGTSWAPSTSGKILQIQSSTKTDQFSTGAYAVGLGAAFEDVSGVSVSITPESSDNNVLINVSGIMSVDNSTQYAFLRLVRNFSEIAQSTGAEEVNSTFVSKMSSASDIMHFSFSFLDSPNTDSVTTYKLQAANQDPGRILFFNRGSASNDYRGITTITAMEVRS